jgi:Protein of unknown function (DUF1353)
VKRVAGALGRALLALVLWPLQAWAGWHYRHTQAGILSGTLAVAWYRPDLFVYTPDAQAPLVFTRHDGQRIEPARMVTDGGSIPRALWILRNYSPWGFGPAFVIHDWLFHMRACKLPGYEAYSLQLAAQVLSEVMKTLLQLPGFDYGSRTSMFLMYLAVQSAPARRAWDLGRCIEAPVAGAERTADALIRISFP